MKRHGNLWDKVTDIENIKLAHKNASKGKAHYREVKMVNENPEHYFLEIQKSLMDKTYTTGKYRESKIFDGRKERVVHKLPYFPDRIVHHALLNIVGEIFESSLIRDTFQSLKGRGTRDAMERVRKFVRGGESKYALKVDIKKYYPSVDNGLLKTCVERKIKCKDTLWLLHDIIDSIEGLPIGNYTSQILGNLYLSSFDWWVKQTLKIKGYFRYCDDIVFFGDDKEALRTLKQSVVKELAILRLEIKPDWKISNVLKEGVDFVGYVFSPHTTKLRKGIARNLVKAASKYSKEEGKLSQLMSFKGWVIPTNNHGLFVKNLDVRLINKYGKQMRGLHGW